jgi:hypothetical protein
MISEFHSGHFCATYVVRESPPSVRIHHGVPSQKTVKMSSFFQGRVIGLTVGFYAFIRGLFNDDISGSDYRASNGRMPGKDLEE